MKCRHLILCLLAMLFALDCAALSKVSGRVVDSSDSRPVDYASVLFFVQGKEGPVASTYTDAEGRFVVSIENGGYTMMVRSLGYDVDTRSIAVKGNVDLPDVKLRPLEQGLAEVEVVARKKQVVYKIDKRVIEASSNLLAGGGSAVDVLENTPSVRVNADGEVTFRGSTGFTVYVDGKPSVFSGTQALEQIPAGHIDNIEIITTPSARYDTEGAVGIINIITKHGSDGALSGMVNVSGSTVLSREIDFLLSKQSGTSRWHFGGKWDDKLRKSDFDQEKTTVVSDLTTTSHSKGPRKSNNFDYSLKGGWRYEMASTRLNADIEGGYGGRTRNGDLAYGESRRLKGGETESGSYLSRDDYDLHETYFQGTVGFDQKFSGEGHNLSGSFYLKYGGNALEFFSSELLDESMNRVKGHRAYEDEHRWTVKGNLDYVRPYRATGRVELGYQYFSYLEDGDYTMYFWNPESQSFYERDDIYNTFYFQHGINSLYAIASDKFGNVELQVGVRGEHTHRVLRSSIPGKDRTYNDIDFFPSAHVGYDFSGGSRLLAAYSRRITRPQLFYMEPYITYRDFYTAEIGNPDIRSEYIDSYELTYKSDVGVHSLSATAFHRRRKDKIERLRVPYEAGVTLDSMANVGNDYSTGIELSGHLQPARWWNTMINGNVYFYKVINRYKTAGEDGSSTNYDFTWSNTFDLGRATKLQLDGNFVGPSVTTQGRTDSYWFFNMAVRQYMLDRKLTLTLSMRDLFGSARYVSKIMTPDLTSVTRIRPKYPLISLTVSYAFNNFKRKTESELPDRDIFEGTNH